MEDYLRFALDDAHLTAECKAIRHSWPPRWPTFAPKERHAAADTQADVGTELTLSTEQTRDGLGGVVQANFKRLEQSLREFGRVSENRYAGNQRRIRATALSRYTLEARRSTVTRHSLDRLTAATLCARRWRESAEACERLVTLLIAAGVSMIQLPTSTSPTASCSTGPRCVRS